MVEKNVNARIVHKHDTEENWLKATSFIPKQGELIVYDIDSNYTYERIKIGDGKTVVSSLPFCDDAKGNHIVTATSTDGVAYTATVPGITKLTAGASFIMIPGVVSASTQPTLNVNGLGAKYIRRRLSNLATATQVGYTNTWLAVNYPFRVVYDGTQWIVEGHNKPVSADLYGSVPIAKGGTGASTAEEALANLGIYIGDTEPTDTNIKIWINTAEEGIGVVPILPRVATITLSASAWTGSASPYSQVVEINTVTTATKIDLQPTVAQMVSLQNDDIALMAENDNSVVTIYSFGGKPSSDMTMQVQLMEVSYV